MPFCILAKLLRTIIRDCFFSLEKWKFCPGPLINLGLGPPLCCGEYRFCILYTFMYRRPVLCTLYGAVDFLLPPTSMYPYSMDTYTIVGGGGLPTTPHPLNTSSHNTDARRPPHHSYTQQHKTALGYIKLPMYQLFLWRWYLMMLHPSKPLNTAP